MAKSVKFCTHCGAKNEETARFCVKCGAKIPSLSSSTSSDAAKSDFLGLMTSKAGWQQLWAFVRLNRLTSWLVVTLFLLLVVFDHFNWGLLLLLIGIGLAFNFIQHQQVSVTPFEKRLQQKHPLKTNAVLLKTNQFRIWQRVLAGLVLLSPYFGNFFRTDDALVNNGFSSIFGNTLYQQLNRLGGTADVVNGWAQTDSHYQEAAFLILFLLALGPVVVLIGTFLKQGGVSRVMTIVASFLSLLIYVWMYGELQTTLSRFSATGWLHLGGMGVLSFIALTGLVILAILDILVMRRQSGRGK